MQFWSESDNEKDLFCLFVFVEEIVKGPIIYSRRRNGKYPQHISYIKIGYIWESKNDFKNAASLVNWDYIC